MQKQAQFLSRQRIALLVYNFIAVGMLALYGLLGMMRNGWPTFAAPVDHDVLAVLVPLSGPNADLGQAVLRVAEQAVKARPAELKLDSRLDVRVVGYDTGGTPDGAASAILKAASNPATLAVIGPLDARQALAAVETLQGESLAVISPASTAPSLKMEYYPGLYRIPAPDNVQGGILVDFLVQNLHRSEIFLIVEPSAYAQGLMAGFNDAVDRSQVDERLHVVGTLDLSREPLPISLAQRIANSDANAVVFLGGLKNARIVLKAMNAAGLQLPLVGSDALNDPAVLPLPGDSVPVYYTSSILNLPAAVDRGELSVYQQALGSKVFSPFAYETTQATWLVLDALGQGSAHGSPATRKAVWQNLARASVPGMAGDVSFSEGRSPEGHSLSHLGYVYQVTSGSGLVHDWLLNRLVHVVRTEGGGP